MLKGKRSLLLISAAVILLNIIRCPQLLLSPRFFAEEGTTYFSGAFHNSFFGNIFSAHYGYYTLYNQIATSLATLPPLEYAPLVTTAMCLVLQTGVSLYLLWGDIPLLDAPARKVVMAVAVPLLSWPGHWLTTIGAQSWLAVGAFFLLISSDRDNNLYNHLFKAGYLVLAGLTGVISCFMTPAYLLRGIREKSYRFCAYGAILMVCFTIHLTVLLHAILTGSPEITTRFIKNSLTEILGKSVVYEFAIPFTGRKVFEIKDIIETGARIKIFLENTFGVHLLIHDLFMLPVIAGISIIIITGIIFWQNRFRLEIQLIAVAFVSVTILSNVCSVNSAGGPRYCFIPSLMLFTLFVCAKKMKLPRPLGVMVFTVVCSTLLANGVEYRSIMKKQAYNPSYPDWRKELAVWKSSLSYQINIWPSAWKMNLDKRVTYSRVL